MERIWKGSQSVVFYTTEASRGLVIVGKPREIRLVNMEATTNTLSASFHIQGMGIHGSLMNVYGPQISAQKIYLLRYLEWFV